MCRKGTFPRARHYNIIVNIGNSHEKSIENYGSQYYRHFHSHCLLAVVHFSDLRKIMVLLAPSGALVVIMVYY